VLHEGEARFIQALAGAGSEEAVRQRAEGVDVAGRARPDATDPSFEMSQQSVASKPSKDSPCDSGAGLWGGVISEVETVELIACCKSKPEDGLEDGQISGAELVPELFELAAADTTAHEGTP